MINPLVDQFGSSKRWVNYKLLKVKGKLTKIPYQINGRKASTTDEATWSTYELCKESNEQVGIVFTPDRLLIGIDIDHCIEDGKIVHEEKEKIADLILEAETYTEVSVSGTGLHLFLLLSEPLELHGNKKAPFEIYDKGRYFTFTGNCYGEPKEVRAVTHEEALKILALIDYPWKEVISTDIPQSTHPGVKSTHLDDETVLFKMFNSKNGEKIKSLYDGNIAEYDNDKSTADMALCSHLAFWTGRNSEQMERIWIGSPIGNREKTTGRLDYRQRTVAVAVANCKEIYESGATKIEKDNEGLDLLFTMNSKKDKVFTQNTENMCRILRFHAEFKDKLRYDSFKNVLEIFVPKYGTHVWRPFEDHDVVNIQTKISILFPCFGKVGKEMVSDAIIKVSKENEIDSASDFIKSIVWDKKPRLKAWLTEVYGTPRDVYHEAVGSNWLKGLVKRIIEPGCKFDHVLVLEGPQGARKSTSLSILGEMEKTNWHVETTMSTDSKDFFMQFSGKAIIEFSEGETLSRTEVKKMKAIITMQSDKYRPPYGRVSQDFPRRCVFAMTTNQTEYLKDETGNRRWLPVALKLPEANIEWLRANRDQLLAEAYQKAIIDKETIYEFPKEETLAQQNARRIHDENEDLIVSWYLEKLTVYDRQQGITVYQVYKDAFHGGMVGGKILDKYQEMKICDVLKNTLKLVKRRASVGGSQLMRWFNDNNVAEQLIEVDDLEKFEINHY